MLMKVFPHGTGEGDKPSRYLVRPDYPGRDTAPPHVLCGDPALTRALIDSKSGDGNSLPALYRDTRRKR